ncbi:unnamed protein product, partial [Musa hybrid cultivar]
MSIHHVDTSAPKDQIHLADLDVILVVVSQSILFFLNRPLDQ